MNRLIFYRFFCFFVRSSAIVCASAVLIFAVQFPVLSQTTKPPTVDRARLEVIEELSESLANDLLELSVAARDRDPDLTAEFFPAQIAGNAFPTAPLPAKNQVKWINRHGWRRNGSGETQNYERGIFARLVAQFLEHFY